VDIRFLEILCDPITKEKLHIESIEEIGDNVITGFLFSETHKYPIIRGVPRFNLKDTSEEYTKSFGYQWNKWPYVQFEGENIGRPMSGHTLRMFERINERTANEIKLSNEIYCDIGCGSGRFIDLLANGQASIIGVDSSDSVEAAALKFLGNARVLICQADILNLPIRENQINHVYSIGVLHHTANPIQGVSEIARVMKIGGTAAISVYGKGGYYDDPIVRIYRKFFSKTWPVFGHYLPLVYSRSVVFFFRPLEKFKKLKILLKPIIMYFPHIQLPDYSWSVLDTFDSVTPSYQKGISPFELYSYMDQSGMSMIKPTDWGGTSLKGVRLK
jgi:ubiquinone/menaquinone biosynthesis C-methylase UbiE/uncharacterized protein YbaR (Trm112 family)